MKTRRRCAPPFSCYPRRTAGGVQTPPSRAKVKRRILQIHQLIWHQWYVRCEARTQGKSVNLAVTWPRKRGHIYLQFLEEVEKGLRNSRTKCYISVVKNTMCRNEKPPGGGNPAWAGVGKPEPCRCSTPNTSCRRGPSKCPCLARLLGNVEKTGKS